jgi:hypothetical protein
MNRTQAALACACVFFCLGSLFAQSKSALETAREFYAWYVPLAQHGTPEGSAEVYLLKHRPETLTERLAKALQADYDASAANSEEIVGLDGDPILDTQDPCESYEVGKPKINGIQALIPVYKTCLGKRSYALTAEFWHQGKLWRLANVRYPRGQDLLSLLRTLREDRERKR